MTLKAQVRCKSIEATTVSNFCLLLLIFYDFWPKMGQNSYRSIVLAKI